MSNGTPEIFEGGPEGPPSLLVVLSIVYAGLWILGGIAALVFRWPWLTSRAWLVVGTGVLFVASLAVVGREIGFFGAASKRPRNRGRSR